MVENATCPSFAYGLSICSKPKVRAFPPSGNRAQLKPKQVLSVEVSRQNQFLGCLVSKQPATCQAQATYCLAWNRSRPRMDAWTFGQWVAALMIPTTQYINRIKIVHLRVK